MKTMKFWFVMAVAAVLTGMVFTSCEEDDPILPPEVIESEVLESGCSSTVTEEAGTEGTSLSYESWIYVRQTTRASSDSKISVTLFNRFNNVVEEVDVADFNFGTPEVKLEHRAVDSRVEQTYVTVTDSVLVYSLNYENGFKLEYELMYETPEYNDGITKQMMPYHSIGQITDNGMKLSGMEDQVVDGVNYFRKLVQHSITVSYNGKTYDVSASVVVRSEEPAEDILLASEKINEGIELVSTDVENAKGVYRSWIEVKQTWSESGVKTFKKEVLLDYHIVFPNEGGVKTVEKKYDDLRDFYLEISTDDTVIEYGTFEELLVVDTHTTDNRIVVKKSNDAGFKFTSFVTSVVEKGRYKDEILLCDFPSVFISDVSANITVSDSWKPSEEQADLLLLETSLYFSIDVEQTRFGSSYKFNIGYFE